MIEMLCGLPMITDFVITHIPGERGADLEDKNPSPSTDIHNYSNTYQAPLFFFLRFLDQIHHTDFVITHIPGERGADLEELKDIFDQYADKAKQMNFF